MVDAWKHSVETGQPYDLEFRQRRADGMYRWFQSRALPTRDTEGRIVRWYNLLTDIDEGKRAEDALRSNEQSLRLTVDSIPGFVSTMSAAGEAEFVSRRAVASCSGSARDTSPFSAAPRPLSSHPEFLESDF